MTYMATPQHKGVMKFAIWVYPTLVIITLIILSLSDLCLGVEKKIHKINGFSLFDFGQALAQKPPNLMVNSGRPFFGQHYYTLSCLNYASE